MSQSDPLRRKTSESLHPPSLRSFSEAGLDSYSFSGACYRIICLLFLAAGAVPAAAHICGPPRLELKVGEACVWPIIADLIEVDVADRDAVKANFTNQPNTTVTSAGGHPSPDNANAGQNGWDFPGAIDGLERAIQQAGAAIAASADPAAEQFILFVGDHGSQTAPFLIAPLTIGAGGLSSFKLNLGGTNASASSLSYTINITADNKPAIEVEYTLDADDGGQSPDSQSPPPPIRTAAGALVNLEVELTIPGRPVIRLAQGDTHIFDVDGDGVVDPSLGEHFTSPVGKRSSGSRNGSRGCLDVRWQRHTVARPVGSVSAITSSLTKF